jgi:opacity protein-like surface antigen
MKNSLKKMLKNSGLILMMLPVPALAGSYWYNAYLGGTLGLSYAKVSDKNPEINYYGVSDAYPTTANASSAMGGLNGGIELTDLSEWMNIDLGLGFYGALAYQFRGSLIETPAGSTGTALDNYQYTVSTMRLMLEAQANFIFNHFSPFVNVGIGPSWNTAKQYKESPIPSSGYPPLPPFEERTSTSFAYQAGLGISYIFGYGSSYAVPQDQRLSLGYRYASLGNISFGSRGAVYPYKLNFGTLSANEVYLAYVHTF